MHKTFIILAANISLLGLSACSWLEEIRNPNEITPCSAARATVSDLSDAIIIATGLGKDTTDLLAALTAAQLIEERRCGANMPIPIIEVPVPPAN